MSPLVGDAEAVIEWTMFWRPRGAGPRVATRGAEWFPYAARGYSTGSVERSALHGH